MSKENEQFGILELRRKDLDQDPFKQFDKWFEDARNSSIKYPEAFVLTTADRNGNPSSRVLLYKGRTDNGFRFYTNDNSKKGQEIKNNNTVSMCFWWDALERQVRIDGSAFKLDESEIDEYFNSRPYGSRIGAWASDQSSVIESREVLENSYKEFEEKFEVDNVPRPPYWIGYRVIPMEIEFWQGRKNRLHDRFRYINSNGSWTIDRLAP